MVREDLERNNVEEAEIRVIVRLVDSELQLRLLTKTTNEKSVGLIWIGATLAALGAAITIGTYTGLIDMGNSFLMMYGPFLGGMPILLGGLGRKRRS